MKTEMIHVNKLYKSYDKEVLKGVEFSVKKGEVICLIGASGSGKTTLLRCLNLLETPDLGGLCIGDMEVDFSQKPLKKTAIQTLRSYSGMVFQNFQLFPHKTVLENVIEAPIVVKKLRKEMVLSAAQELLDKVGLLEHQHQYPHTLSGGQQQRAAIARALIMDPEVMLFDEPTSALDPQLVREVLKVIETLAREGQTMVIVTHELQFAKRVANRILFMSEGRILEEGTPKQILYHPQHGETREFVKQLSDE